MDVKESFQNIVEWAKKHPWLAGGILLILVLIAWWISKQGIGSGSSISSNVMEEPEEPTLGTLEPVTSGGGSLLDSFTNTSGGVTQTPPVYDAPVFDQLPALSDMTMTDAGYFDPGFVQEAVYSAPVESSVGRALADIAPASPSSLGSLGSNFFFGDLSYSTKEVTPKKITSTKEVQPKQKASTPNKNPAQQKGKGKNFTGYIDGVYYVKGYPAAASSLAATTTTKPSQGAQVSPAQGGGFFTGQYLTPTLPTNKANTKAATTAGAMKNKKGGSI